MSKPKKSVVDPRKVVARSVDTELLDALEVLFPNPTPIPGQPIDRIMYESGQARVVQFMRELYEEAQHNILE